MERKKNKENLLFLVCRWHGKGGYPLVVLSKNRQENYAEEICFFPQ